MNRRVLAFAALAAVSCHKDLFMTCMMGSCSNDKTKTFQYCYGTNAYSYNLVETFPDGTTCSCTINALGSGCDSCDSQKGYCGGATDGGLGDAGDASSLADLTTSPDFGPTALGKGNCEPRMAAAGICDGAHGYAYNCGAAADKTPPETTCVAGAGILGGQFQCCPDPLCQRTPVYDPVCTMLHPSRPRSFSCWAGAGPPADCVLTTGGDRPAFCCP